MHSFLKSLALPLTAAGYCLLMIFTCCREESFSASQELTDLGGIATVTGDFSNNAFGHSVAGLNGGDKSRFVLGNSFFRDNWVTAPASTTARDGLGALFNMTSCGGCHQFDGRGRPPVEPGEEITSLLIRLSTPGTGAHGGPLPDPVYGRQLQTRAIMGAKPEAGVHIAWREMPGTYSDGTPYSLRVPAYEFKNLAYGNLHGSLLFSPRVAPQMPGMGLLEAIEEQTILGMADPDDKNRDGISGKVNYVWDEAQQRTVMGRFGWKANQPTLRQQVAAAFHGDMGLTSSLFAHEELTPAQLKLYGKLPNGGAPEVSDKILDAVTFYSAALAVPAQRGGAEVLEGQRLFVEANCQNCHVMTLKTGKYDTVPQLSGQTIHPFTDLLLHDMGEGLADQRPDFLATGSEWRTPPLWGLGMIATVNKHSFLLHDGRARSIEEAILWHGGEAENSKNAFLKMSEAERKELIKFLKSL